MTKPDLITKNEGRIVIRTRFHLDANLVLGKAGGDIVAPAEYLT